MKRKFLFPVLFCLLLCGCQARVNIIEHMSEITTIYFEGENEFISASISVGMREKEYIIDGKSSENIDFSLVSLKFSSDPNAQQIEVEICINDKVENAILYLNPMNNVYINDLGYSLRECDEVKLSYCGNSVELHKQNFNISYVDALSIAENELKNDINNNLKNGELNGECYLKVLSASDNDSKFWLFTLVNSKCENINILIDVNSGRIMRA